MEIFDKMSRLLYTALSSLILGIGLRAGWEACEMFKSAPPSEIYLIQGDHVVGSTEERVVPFKRLDLKNVQFSIFGMSAKGEDEKGNSYTGRIYPRSKRAYLELDKCEE